jgi:parvulin-like peptidyl-prolyl isomerase
MSRGTRSMIIGLSELVLIGLAGPLYAQAPAAQNKPAAIVNGEPIPLSELQQLLAHTPRSPNPLTAEQQRERRKMALDMLIDDVLMRQFLKRTGITVSPAEVDKEMEDLRQGLAKNKSSLEQFLKENGQTLDGLRADIIARLQWRAYLISQVPDNVLKTYYDQNKVFFDKVMVKASHILLRVPPKASDSDKAAIRARLAALRQDILAGKMDFAQAAKTYSDCPSKVNGGDIGFFPYKFVVQDSFAKAAFALNKGDVSDIIETDFGYHILKVTDRTAGEPSDFQKIKDWVRDVYAQDTQLYQRILQRERASARIEVMPP